RTIRALNAIRYEAECIESHARQTWRAGMKMARIQAVITPATTVSLQVTLLVILALGGARVAAGVISVGEIVAFLLFLIMLTGPLGELMSMFTNVNRALGAWDRISSILKLESEEPDSLQKREGVIPPAETPA